MDSLWTEINSSDLICGNAATLEYIPTVRAEVYPEPQLETGKTQPCPAGGRRLTEWLRRREERKLLGQLSRFYQLPASEPSGERNRKGEKKKEKGWTAPSLLREGKHESCHRLD